MNWHNWFPFCTWTVGLPGETGDDTKKSLDLLLGKTMKCPLVRPAHFPEKILKRRLYLDLREKSALRAPEAVEIPQPKSRPVIRRTSRLNKKKGR